jgi:hypothetical protein
VSVQPAVGVALKGSVSLLGEYSVRSWKQSENVLIVGVYKKKGTTFKASFTAAAGIGVNAGNTELASTILSAAAPGVDTRVLGDRAVSIARVLKESIDRSIAISLNASSSTSLTDESALVYRVDLTGDAKATDEALNAAIRGDWTLLSQLSNAKELKNLLGHTVETKHKVIVNLLGIYNYESLNDFARSSTVLHSFEDGSITITDSATAKRIAVASTPFAADADRLRQVLNEATISTAAYAFAKTGALAQLHTKQTLLRYEEHMKKPALLKELRVGPALRVIRREQIEATAGADNYKHVLIEVEQELDARASTNMFFSDPQKRIPYEIDHLAALGRNVLAQFLDPEDPVDQKRLKGLGPGWNQEAPPSDPVLRVDWLDIMWWATAIHRVGRPLAEVLDAFAKLPPDKDPSSDPDFAKKRKALTAALENAAKNAHSAFEDGWPLAVTFDIARSQTSATMRASWDGKVKLEGNRAINSPSAQAVG